MKHPRTPERLSSSRIRETWRSLLSWMRWRRRRELRMQHRLDRTMDRLMQEQRERLLFQLLTVLPKQDHLEDRFRLLLLEAMRPLAAALERQDSLLLEERQKLTSLVRTESEDLQSLLLEVLQSLQPPVEQQLLPDGRSNQPPSSHNWAS